MEQLTKGKVALFQVPVRMNRLQEDKVSSSMSSSSSTENEFDFEKYMDHKELAKCHYIEVDSFKPIKNKLSKFQMPF